MKSIPRSYIMEFSAGLSGVNQTAKFKMRQALYEVDLSDIDAARAQIADIMVQVVGASDAMASTMAAGFYDGIREYQTGAALGATADSGWEPDSTRRATYGITDRLAKADAPDISMVEGLLTQRIGYEVKRSAGRTMYRNGSRDPNKPKFARIPLGGDSCEFCRMLASRGFAYNSEKSAGKHDPDHYHDGCRCEVVCSWEKDPRIAGLSEDEYNDRAYGEHRDAYRSWASKDHSQHRQHQQEKRRNRYTDDGRLRAGYSGLRIDKQAAYTEADRKKVSARAAAQRGNTQRGTKRRSLVAASPTYLDKGDVLYERMQLVKPIEGYMDFGLHCDGYIFTRLQGSKDEFTPEEIADWILSDPRYDGGPVRLLACMAGKYPDGAAQRVANRLGKPVLAPTEELYINYLGEYNVARAEELSQMIFAGEAEEIDGWKLFEPNGGGGE